MKNQKIGIIGGGQLGLLLSQAAINFPAHVSIYDPDSTCPAKAYSNEFKQGAFDDFDAIVEFGKNKDAIIFETEKTNVKALKALQEMGKKVLSSPSTLEWIQNKRFQKEKFIEAGIKTADFKAIKAEEVNGYQGPFPIVQKWEVGGYDGYGVQVHKNLESISKAKACDSIFESLVDIDKELSMLVARSEKGEIEIYPAVEMVFDPAINLVDYLFSPANISDEIAKLLKETTKQIAEKLNFVGIYAIEYFLDKKGELYVNEISPRPHNSGHHTVSANITSQYEQQIRLALGLPLGSSEMISPCVMMNLLGADTRGETHYIGMEEAYKLTNVQYVLYGKDQVKPSRKMGHALILEKSIEQALEKMKHIRKTLTITSNEQ